NLNAPLPGTSERPTGDVFNIYQIESTGSRHGHSATATFSGRLWHFKTFAQYTWSHVMDNTANSRYLPADNYNLQPEWGPANFDQRHRVSVMATRMWAAESWRASPILVISSGLPYNIITGFDDNGDTIA